MMKLRIVEMGDGRFHVQGYNSGKNEWVADVNIEDNFRSAIFRTYDEAVMYIENLKDMKENGDKKNKIKQIHEEFEI